MRDKQVLDWSNSSVRWSSYEGIPFAVSSCGFIYMPPYVDKLGRSVKGNCTRGNPNNFGYHQFQLGRRNHKIHIVVASAFIGERPEGMFVDHIDGDKSNNDASNLRYLTPRQNMRACRKNTRGSTSRYRGVHWNTRDQNWVSSIKHCGKSIRIGSFKCEHDAAAAYNKKRQELGWPIEGQNLIKR